MRRHVKETALRAAMGLCSLLGLASAGCSAVCRPAEPAPAGNKASTPPFKYVWGRAYLILPYTTADNSGYFSLCEGLNGRIYVGTAQYDFNCYLVEVDPRTGKQRIVIDTRWLTGSWAAGYASQSKIHTRNFVGPSGKIYVGSKAGYRRIPGDSSEYPGGYLMTYDPKTDQAECLGMPYPKEGIIDVVADEQHGLIYIVTLDEDPFSGWHYVLYDVKAKTYRELGPLMTGYATTLSDSRGRANAITKEFQLYQYDPDTGKSTTRDIWLGGKKWTPTPESPLPTWRLAADGRTAYLINLVDPALYELDLGSDGEHIEARNVGLRTTAQAGKCDSYSSLAIASDGRVYTLVRVPNETGFGGPPDSTGGGYLHHLTRYTPRTRQMEDLGVIAVKNPDFYDFSPLWNGKPKPWSGGFPKLPDGVMAPVYAHMGLIVAHDGTLYATFLYPYTLMRIERVK